jgi:hypothetical protein
VFLLNDILYVSAEFDLNVFIIHFHLTNIYYFQQSLNETLYSEKASCAEFQSKLDCIVPRACLFGNKIGNYIINFFKAYSIHSAQ